jgi:hypothetical protein
VIRLLIRIGVMVGRVLDDGAIAVGTLERLSGTDDR